MSNLAAVRVENLSKLYRIGTGDTYATFREALVDAFAAPFRRARLKLQGSNGHVAETEDTIWALRDVSFEIKGGRSSESLAPMEQVKARCLRSFRASRSQPVALPRFMAESAHCWKSARAFTAS